MLIRQSRILLSSISALALLGAAATANAGGNELITKDSFYGEPLQAYSYDPTISADGNVVAFASDASELTSGSGNPLSNIYIKDRISGIIERIEVLDTDGTPLYGTFHSPHISANGQYVAFRFSDGSSDIEGERVYVHDRVAGTSELISIVFVDQYFLFENRVSVSDDGQKVAYVSHDRHFDAADNNGYSDIFVFDRVTQTETRVNLTETGEQTDGTSFNPMISGDGSAVIFYSEATNLPGLSSNGALFRKSLDTGELINVVSDHEGVMDANGFIVDFYISTDGEYIVFTLADDEFGAQDSYLISHYLYSHGQQTSDHLMTLTGLTTLAIPGVSISDDGNRILYGVMETVHDEIDIPEARLYLYDNTSGQNRLISSRATEWKSRGLSGVEFHQQISRDGNSFAFQTGLIAPDVTPRIGYNIFVGDSDPGHASPIANAGPDTFSVAGEFTMDGTASSDDLTAAGDLRYDWEYVTLVGEEIALENVQDYNTATPTFRPWNDNSFLIRLTVSDEEGLFSSSDYALVSPDNQPPIVDAGPDQSVFLGETVSVNGTATDPDGDSLSLNWALTTKPSGSTASLYSNNETGQFTPDIAGTYYARFRASDNYTSVFDLTRITVIDPIAYAADQVSAARIIIAGLSNSDFDGRKSQRTLLGYLDDALDALSSGDNAGAISWIDETIKRSDGCSINGAPDGKGKGKDWITNCSAATQVYELLIDAKSVL